MIVAASLEGEARVSCRPLKVFLVELALGWAGEAHGLQLHGDWKLPKMRYKGSPHAPEAVPYAPAAGVLVLLP